MHILMQFYNLLQNILTLDHQNSIVQSLSRYEDDCIWFKILFNHVVGHICAQSIGTWMYIALVFYLIVTDIFLSHFYITFNSSIKSWRNLKISWKVHITIRTVASSQWQSHSVTVCCVSCLFAENFAIFISHYAHISGRFMFHIEWD